jgi:hypothetical protein
MLKNYLIERAKEASTWTGILLFIEATAGIHASDGFNSAAAGAILAAIGLGAAAVKEPWFRGLFK